MPGEMADMGDVGVMTDEEYMSNWEDYETPGFLEGEEEITAPEKEFIDKVDAMSAALAAELEAVKKADSDAPPDMPNALDDSAYDAVKQMKSRTQYEKDYAAVSQMQPQLCRACFTMPAGLHGTVGDNARVRRPKHGCRLGGTRVRSAIPGKPPCTFAI